MKYRAYLVALLVILIWGITFANTRALLEDFSALEIQLVRFALAWAALWIVDLAKFFGSKNRDDTACRLSCFGGRNQCRVSEWLFVGMGLTGVFLYQLLENCAIYYTNASNVAILVSFGPIVTALMARFWMHDRSLSFRFCLGSIVSVVGVTLVSMNGVVNFDMRPLGDLMALSAIGCWGVYSILIDRANQKGVPAMVAIRKAFGWALVLMLPLTFWGATSSGYTALDGSFSITLDSEVNAERFADMMNLVNLGFLGLLASAAAFSLWNLACRELGVVRTTIGLYLTPIVGIIFAALFLDERLTVMSLSGGVLILIGVIAATFKRR